ncbi:MAG: F0F1 ATP synthase subunit A [Actinomycetes bacterium]
MTTTGLVLAGSCTAGSGCGFPAPGTASFDYQPVFTVLGFGVTKPALLLVSGTVLIAVAMLAAFARPRLVPTGWQNVMERYYDFIRKDIAADVIGREGIRYAPYLATVFAFVFVMNFFEIVPGAQFPVTSRIAYPAMLAALTWLIYNVIGVRRHGLLGYLRGIMFPPGLPWWIYIILAPIELFSTIIVRPFTLAVRLFANMFAGHLLLLVFTLGTTYLLVPRIQALFAVVSFGMTFVLTAFELLIQLLQAFIFTLLTASYISGALAEEH